MQRAKHTISFGQVYRSTPCGNIDRCIKISIYNIYFAICVDTFKRLICSFSNIFTFITSLRSVSRVNHNQLNTIKQRLVFKFYSQVSKRPSSKFGFKFFGTSFTCKSNIRQILDCNYSITYVSHI